MPQWNKGSILIGGLMCASAIALGIGDTEYGAAVFFLAVGVTFISMGLWARPSLNRGVLVAYGLLLVAVLIGIVATYQET